MTPALNVFIGLMLLLPQAPAMPLGQPKMALDLVLDAPDQVGIGDLVPLDSTRSQGVTATAWAVSPKKAQAKMMVVENGARVAFASGEAGTYTFYLAGTTADGKTVRIVSREVVVGSVPPNPVPPGPGPNPVPPTPVPPNPPPGPAPTPLGLTQFVIDEAAKVTDPNKAAVAAMAVKACDEVLRLIGNGTLTKQADIHEEFRKQLSGVGFFAYLRYWQTFLSALASKFDSLGFDDPNTTKEQLLQAYTEVGAGLRQVR